MIIQLANAWCNVRISPHGAELKSLQSVAAKQEYIWQADPAIWERSAPFLFPNVGRLKENTYFYQNKKYHLGQHGFLRDQDFQLVEHTENQAVLQFESTEETQKNYPFTFRTTVTYTLRDNTLVVAFTVKNLGDKKMYFSYGNHAGFCAPINPDLTFEDYAIELLPHQRRKRIRLTKEKQSDLEHPLLEESNRIALTHEKFKKDALIYQTEGETQIRLYSDKDPRQLIVSYEGFSYVGIWSPYPTTGDFVCIQPWCGIADPIAATQQWTQKPASQELAANQEFTREFRLTID
ncbi:aldose 1-epimerase [Enterococcus florum]|uniref:Aldose 1-epimerase n=1 Tax=Enterococcus florum TaxID=2480627 RepID=A0A4P5PF40_9ENTE|nr:aldose 1-epimerase family protein [Enterococcus florum]GCF94838.1 aldose 1-epimerase [Enterococcus florum]